MFIKRGVQIKKIVFCILLVFIYLYSAESSNESESIILENFESYSSSEDLLNNWLLRNDNKNEASKIYNILSVNNNKFLHAKSSCNSIQIAKKVEWDIKSFPVLTWKWRAIEIPKGANESARGKNDSGAALYVIFQRKKIPLLSWKYQPINVIKYTWSTSLPVGSVVNKDKKKLGKIIYEGKFIVIGSGRENQGKWIIEERNVLEDYIQVFGKPPKDDPVLIAILSDSNDTKSTAVADYDEIVIKKMMSNGSK